MENKELKEFKKILHEVTDTNRFLLFMCFCEPLKAGAFSPCMVRIADRIRYAARIL